MKEIQLTQGQVALVDDSDYEELGKYKWYAQKRYKTKNFDAVRNGRFHVISMQRQILGLELGDKRQGDHINRNPLDNRRSNLRIATASENMRNRRLSARNASGF